MFYIVKCAFLYITVWKLVRYKTSKEAGGSCMHACWCTSCECTFNRSENIPKWSHNPSSTCHKLVSAGTTGGDGGGGVCRKHNWTFG